MTRSRQQDGLPIIEITCFYEELPLPGVGIVSAIDILTCARPLIRLLGRPAHSAILHGYIPIGFAETIWT